MGNPVKIAVLIDQAEINPPSDHDSLENLKQTAKEVNAEIDFLTKQELNKLKDYQSLFIRTLTDIDNYTYQWAELAEYLGLNIIDTTRGISLGSNKHLQYELCKINRINIPKSQFLHEYADIKQFDRKKLLKFPLVLKTPNGAFSTGVYQINDFAELRSLCRELYAVKNYHALVLQEFIYTDYDWRIGILNRQPLFACKYYMVRDHWQIIKYGDNGLFAEGDAEAVPLNQIPQKVMDCVNELVKLLDQGFYGVDIKLYNNIAYLIEINDNPNLCTNVEDKVDTEVIYRKVLNNLIGKK